MCEIMVLERMLDYGFNGFQVPDVPRASRSARGRRPSRKKFQVPRVHAFEILASLATTLLGKSDNSLHTNASSDEILHAPDDAHSENNLKSEVTTSVDVQPTKTRITSVKEETNDVTTSSEDLMKLEEKPAQLVNPQHDEQPFYGPHQRCLDNVRVGSRDDDENSLRSTNSNTVVEAFGLPKGPGKKRIKKMSATYHGRVALDMEDDSYFGNDGTTNKAYDDRRTYTHEKSQKIYPFKKRKFFNHCPLPTSTKGFNHHFFNYPDKRNLNGTSSIEGQQVTTNSKDCNVKLSIQSFTVPELFIDISTSATVGSLKRSVMEAVTSILGDGLHVGILVQGKKVRDDEKTLIQTGISHDDTFHNLGFVLEPKHSQTAPSPNFKDPSSLPKSRSEGLTRHSKSLMLHRGLKTSGGSSESHISVDPTFGDTSSDKTNPEAQALVAVPAISMEPLTVVPFHRKPGRPEYVQRRIRRPFSVSEVEALVQAVEKLGTGRWRDIKFHAFDNAKHRTYVDLKDKWKTLVHTARISPQQRRGEPVPQELLDRVLAAQAYWSHR